MKNMLLGTTALIAVSAIVSPAQAQIEVTISGKINVGLGWTDVDSDYDDHNNTEFGTDTDVDIQFRYTGDNGLTFGMDVEIDPESDPDVSNRGLIDEHYVFVSGNFGTVLLGTQEGAGRRLTNGIIPSILGHSVNRDDDSRMDLFRNYDINTGFKVTTLRNTITTQTNMTRNNTKITYISPTFAGFQLGASYTPNPCENDTGYENDCIDEPFRRNAIELGADFRHRVENITFRVSGAYAFAEDGQSTNDPKEWSIGAAVDFGGFSLRGQYAEHDTREETPYTMTRRQPSTDWAVAAQYNLGPTTFDIQYGRGEDEQTGYDYWYGDYRQERNYENLIGGVRYVVGPGVEVGGLLQRIEYENNRHGTMDSTDYATDHFGATLMLGLRF